MDVIKGKILVDINVDDKVDVTTLSAKKINDI